MGVTDFRLLVNMFMQMLFWIRGACGTRSLRWGVSFSSKQKQTSVCLRSWGMRLIETHVCFSWLLVIGLLG